MPEYLNIWSLEAQVNGICISLGFLLSRLSNLFLLDRKEYEKLFIT